MKRILLITTLTHLGHLLVSVAAQSSKTPPPLPTDPNWDNDWAFDTLPDCAHDTWRSTVDANRCSFGDLTCMCNTQFGPGKINNRWRTINYMAAWLGDDCEDGGKQTFKLINEVCDLVNAQPTSTTSSTARAGPTGISVGGTWTGGGGPSGSSSGGSGTWSSNNRKPKLTKAVKAAIGAGSGVGAVVVAFIIWLCCRKPKAKEAAKGGERLESGTSKPNDSPPGEASTPVKGSQVATSEIFAAPNRETEETDLEYQARRLRERREIIERKKRLAEEEEQIAMEEEALRWERAVRTGQA